VIGEQPDKEVPRKGGLTCKMFRRLRYPEKTGGASAAGFLRFKIRPFFHFITKQGG